MLWDEQVSGIKNYSKLCYYEKNPTSRRTTFHVISHGFPVAIQILCTTSKYQFDLTQWWAHGHICVELFGTCQGMYTDLMLSGWLYVDFGCRRTDCTWLAVISAGMKLICQKNLNWSKLMVNLLGQHFASCSSVFLFLDLVQRA